MVTASSRTASDHPDKHLQNGLIRVMPANGSWMGHSVYWDIFTEAAWKVREAEYKAELQRIKDVEARTVDLFRIGEMQPERDHDVQGEKTDAVEFAGRKLRHAYDGGWFSFRVAVPANAPSDLVITYWGSETGRRTFDVLVEGEKIATTSLHRDKPEQFWEILSVARPPDRRQVRDHGEVW
jgi:uncharacterized protein